MLPPELLTALARMRKMVSKNSWEQLTGLLATSGSELSRVHETTDQIGNRDAAWIFSEALKKCPEVSSSEVAAAMSAMDFVLSKEIHEPEIIWSGPVNGTFPVRRIDQVLYDLIANSQRKILLVTFAASRIKYLCAHLEDALQRGVEVTLVLEFEETSGGQLSKDAIDAFASLPKDKLRVCCRPIEKREKNQAGKPGKLHAKCAVVDDSALIGSANLTDDAFNRNLELGVVLRDTDTVNSLSDHFEGLIRNRTITEIELNQR
jgi:phosphatidylserine/phosphatidylglycerophosphate/cardiolipin synthase-like enzyme